MGPVAAVAFGLLSGFFVIWKVLFSDYAPGDFWQTIVYVSSAYFVLGAGLGMLLPARGWKWSLWLVIPSAAVSLGLVAASSEGAELLLRAIMYLGVALGTSVLGALAGSFAGGVSARAFR